MAGTPNWTRGDEAAPRMRAALSAANTLRSPRYTMSHPRPVMPLGGFYTQATVAQANPSIVERLEAQAALQSSAYPALRAVSPLSDKPSSPFIPAPVTPLPPNEHLSRPNLGSLPFYPSLEDPRRTPRCREERIRQALHLRVQVPVVDVDFFAEPAIDLGNATPAERFLRYMDQERRAACYSHGLPSATNGRALNLSPAGLEQEHRIDREYMIERLQGSGALSREAVHWSLVHKGRDTKCECPDLPRLTVPDRMKDIDVDRLNKTARGEQQTLTSLPPSRWSSDSSSYYGPRTVGSGSQGGSVRAAYSPAASLGFALGESTPIGQPEPASPYSLGPGEICPDPPLLNADHAGLTDSEDMERAESPENFEDTPLLGRLFQGDYSESWTGREMILLALTVSFATLAAVLAVWGLIQAQRANM